MGLLVCFGRVFELGAEGTFFFKGVEKVFDSTGEFFLSRAVLIDLGGAFIIQLGDLLELRFGSGVFLIEPRRLGE